MPHTLSLDTCSSIYCESNERVVLSMNPHDFLTCMSELRETIKSKKSSSSTIFEPGGFFLIESFPNVP